MLGLKGLKRWAGNQKWFLIFAVNSPKVPPPKPPPFSYLLSDQEVSSVINTVIGNVPLGSYLGHQLFDKKKSQTAFNVDRPVEKMVANQGARIEPFPDLPLVNVNNSFIPPVLDQPQNAVIEKITINLAES